MTIDEALLLRLKADYEQGVAKAQETIRNAQSEAIANRGATMAIENLLGIMHGKVAPPVAAPVVNIQARMKALAESLAPKEVEA